MPYFNNDNVNILFIHIPKTGGCSLENYFSKKFNIPLNNKSLFLKLEKINNLDNINVYSSLQHMTFHTILKYKEFFNICSDNIKIITIVRNPYERIISDLFFLSKININTSKDEVFDILKQYLSEDIEILDNHSIPQYKFLTLGDTELVQNIKILHTETLQNDMIEFGYEDFDYKQNCNPNKVNYYDYLNNDSIQLLNDFYDIDFKLFNYNKIL